MFLFLLTFLASYSLVNSETYAQEPIGGYYYCGWNLPVSSGFPYCGAVDSHCEVGFTTGDACEGIESEVECNTAGSDPNPCVPTDQPKGWRCDPGVQQCFECTLDEEGCVATDEDACWESCVFSGGNTYSCNPDGLGCVTVTGLGGDFTDPAVCESTCVPPQTSNTEIKCTSGGIEGIDSAIGCIPIGVDVALWRFMIRWAIGIASGISFLLILYAGFLLITSSGHPGKIQAGKELLISAITGLILLIFSVWLLRVIGADILGLF